MTCKELRTFAGRLESADQRPSYSTLSERLAALAHLTDCPKCRTVVVAQAERIIERAGIGKDEAIRIGQREMVLDLEAASRDPELLGGN